MSIVHDNRNGKAPWMGLGLPNLRVYLALLLGCLSLFFGAPIGHAQSLEALQAQLLTQNQDLAALETRIEGQKWMEVGAQNHPDPILSLEYSNMNLSYPLPGQSPMDGIQVKLSQRVISGAYNQALIDLAHSQVHGLRRSKDARINALLARFADDYWQLSHQIALLDLTEAQLELVDSLIRISEAAYHQAQIKQIHLLRLELRQDALSQKRLDHQQTINALEIRLRALMGVDGNAPIHPTALAPAQAMANWQVDTLFATAQASNPALKTLHTQGEMHRRQADLAEKSRFTGVNIWAGYRYRPGRDGGAEEDLISLGVSAPLPFDRGQKSHAQGEKARLDEAAVEQQIHQYQRQLRAQLAAELDQGKRALERHQAYQAQLLATAQAAVESATQNYASNQGNFDDLYQAEAALLMVEEARLKAALTSQIRANRLLELTGQRLLDLEPFLMQSPQHTSGETR